MSPLEDTNPIARKDLLAEISKMPGFPFGAVLSSQLWRDDFEAFVAWRQARIWQEIQQATGLAQVTDLKACEADLT